MSDISKYFDYAAATPVLPEVIEAMQPYFSEHFYNPSALYLAARDNRIVLDDARHAFAQSIGARPTEIIFTAGGTEANNMALRGVLDQYADAHVVTSAIEHESVLQVVKRYDHTLVGVNQKGLVDVAAIERAIRDTTVVVSIMYANNEIGTIQPLAEITAMIARLRKQRKAAGNQYPLLVHTDACQAGNYLDMHTARLGVDMMTINSGKVYGPKQAGALYVKAGIRLQPLLYGGGQEWGIRSGTENLAAIIGFVTAWKKARQNAGSEVKRLSMLRDAWIATLQKQAPHIQLNGATGNRRLANNIHLTLPGVDNERLIMELDEQGFQIAAGSACSASNDEPSHVLKALGLSDSDARSSIRITMGRYTTESSAKQLLEILIKK